MFKRLQNNDRGVGQLTPKGGGGSSASTGTCSDDETDSACSMEETAAKLEVALRRNLKFQHIDDDGDKSSPPYLHSSNDVGL